MFVSSRVRDGCFFVCFAFSFSFLREQQLFASGITQVYSTIRRIQRQDFLCVYLCVRGKVCLCSLPMEPEVIAAMPAASTCQHRHISEVALVLGHNQRRLPRVSAKRKPEGLIE